MGTPNRYAKRQVYQMEQDFKGSEYNPYSIDSPIDYLSINQSIATNPRPPWMSYDQWHRLTDEAKKTWDTLDDKNKRIILESATKKSFFSPSTPYPRRRVYEYDIQHLVACLQGAHVANTPTVSTVSTSLYAQSEGSQSLQTFQDNTLTPEG